MKLNIHYLHSWATSRLMSPSVLTELEFRFRKRCPKRWKHTSTGHFNLWDFHHLARLSSFLPFFTASSTQHSAHQYMSKSPSQGDLTPLQLNVRPCSPATLHPAPICSWNCHTPLCLVFTVCAGYFCHLDTTQGHLWRGTSIQKMPPSDWAVERSLD